MWKIHKPDITDSKQDLDKMVDNGDVPNGDKAALLTLYDSYENQAGHISEQEHNSIPKPTAAKIHDAYAKTTNKMDNTKKVLTYGKYYYIREELMNGVRLCPLCGIAQDLTLDHYMPQSKYPALSMFRQNLVPVCSACNRSKNAQPYTDFIHPYYFIPPTLKKIFLNATIKIHKNSLCVFLDIDETAFTDYTVVERLRSHLKGINSEFRLQNAIISFLQECFVGKYNNEKEIINALPSIMDTYQLYGINHWRLAVLRGIYDVYRRGEIDKFIQVLQYITEESRDQAI